MIKFSFRQRINLFLLTLSIALVPGALALLSTRVGISPRDPQFFDADYRAEFSTDKSLKNRGPILIRSAGRSKLIIQEGSQKGEFAFTPEGTYLLDGKDTGTYPILWVRFPPQEKLNRPEKFIEQINQLRAIDLTGLIGQPGATYSLHNKTSTILWSWTLGSQFSHPVDLIDESGKAVASGTYDSTCGILEELSAYQNGALGVIALMRTDFPMSRNRNFTLVYAFIVACLIVIYHFVWRRKKIGDRKLFRLETDLIILGMMAIFVDEYLDIWFFHSTGPMWLIILHLAVAGFVLWRFGWWVIFPLLELFWAGAFTAASKSVIPQLAFCPALIITWFALLQFQSFKGRLNPKNAIDS